MILFVNGCTVKFPTHDINPTKESEDIKVKHNSEYPKIVYVPSESTDNAPSFEVWLANDGHEYQLHSEHRTLNQWIHYVGCVKCEK